MKKDVVDKIKPESIINKTKRIQSLIDAHLIYDGQSSGKRYEWTKAGAIADVDETDVPELLAKQLGGKSCCGRGGGAQIFQLAD